MAAAKKSTAAKAPAAKKAAVKRTATRKTAPRKTAAAPKAAAPSETAASFMETAAAKAEEALKAMPTIDLSKLDLDAIKQLDPRNIDFSKLDPRNVERPDFDLAKMVEAARDAAYTVVGFGVLAIQRAQVQRRELAESISERFGANRTQVEELIASFEARLTSFDESFEARMDEIVGKIGPKLPEQAETALNQVHSVAKSARQQVRSLLRPAA
ncbi:MAG: hypothetical protein QM733_09825 [Ilumatobacteraceae bacterium]